MTQNIYLYSTSVAFTSLELMLSMIFL